MEVLSIIPDRLSQFSLRTILNKPTIAYTIEASLKSKYITRTLTISENINIINTAERFGSDTLFMNAENMTQALYALESKGWRADYVIVLSPDCPQNDEYNIDDSFAYYLLKSKEGFDSCFSGYISGTTMKKWIITEDEIVKPLSEEPYDIVQQTPIFYALSWETMKQRNNYIGYKPCVRNMPDIINIENISDFLQVEKILKNA